MRKLIVIFFAAALTGCTGMLLGADVTPAEQHDSDEDEDSRKAR